MLVFFAYENLWEMDGFLWEKCWKSARHVVKIKTWQLAGRKLPSTN
jgi:hypothetical protein